MNNANYINNSYTTIRSSQPMPIFSKSQPRELLSNQLIYNYAITNREKHATVTEAFMKYPALDEAVSYYHQSFYSTEQGTPIHIPDAVMNRFISNASNGEYYKKILLELNRLIPGNFLSRRKAFHFFLMPMYDRFLPKILSALKEAKIENFKLNDTQLQCPNSSPFVGLIENVNKKILGGTRLTTVISSLATAGGVSSITWGGIQTKNDPKGANNTDFSQHEDGHPFIEGNIKGYLAISVGVLFTVAGVYFCQKTLRNYLSFKDNYCSWSTYAQHIATMELIIEPSENVFTLQEETSSEEKTRLLSSSSTRRGRSGSLGNLI